MAGVSKNDEVLIPSLNFIASTNATLYCGGIPHFIDIEETTLGVDIKKLDDYLMNNTRKVKGRCINKKTNRMIKAIVPTHLFGHSEYETIKHCFKKYNLKIIEDAAEGIGSFYG